MTRKTLQKIVERTDGRTNGWTDRLTDGPMYGRNNGRMYQWTDGPMDGRTNGRTEVNEVMGDSLYVNGFPSGILTLLFGQLIRALGFDYGPITA